MLATRTLHFACITSLKDPYEGWLPRSYMEVLDSLSRTYRDQIWRTINLAAVRPSFDRAPAQLKTLLRDMECKLHMPRLLKETNEKFGASCWHINEGESEAMWRLYGAAGAGVAIESTKERLEAAMKSAALHTVLIDPVRYMDFDDDPIDKGEHRHLMGFIKRKSFEHERELRAIVMLPEPGKGVGIPCDMNTLVAGIHIAPRADQYYVDAVRYIIDHADPRLDVPVTVSKLLDPPDY